MLSILAIQVCGRQLWLNQGMCRGVPVSSHLVYLRYVTIVFFLQYVFIVNLRYVFYCTDIRTTDLAESLEKPMACAISYVTGGCPIVVPVVSYAHKLKV